MSPVRKIRPFLFLATAAVLALTGIPRVSAQSDYPAIQRLRQDDVIFAQLEDSIQEYYSSPNSKDVSRDFSIYSYTLKSDTDLLALAASLSLPYDSLATLNRLDNNETLPKGRTILVPSIPGVFVAMSPESDLEYLMRSLRAEDPGDHYSVSVTEATGRTSFMFFPGSSFLPAERSFFLIGGFRFPLPRGIITSGFGMRVDPIKGKVLKFHPGIDIAAPSGTTIMAARRGRVVSAGWSDVYGNYVVVLHENDWETLYGHMSRIIARLGQAVETGTVLGLVGSTGLSTGPHLHFEIRKHGAAVDPLEMLHPWN